MQKFHKYTKNKIHKRHKSINLMLSKLRKILLRQEKTNHNGEKLFADHISDKGFIYRMHKELLKCNIKKENNLIKNEPKFGRHFTKDDILFPNEDIKK